MSAVLGGVAQHRILAGDVREAPEIGGIGELVAAGLNTLVATCTNNEGIITSDVFSLMVAVVLVTTLVTPMLLKWSFREEPLPSLQLDFGDEQEVLAIG